MADRTPEEQARYDIEAARLKAERQRQKDSAKQHLHDGVDDAIRVLRRVKKRGDDQTSIATDLRAAELAIKSAKDGLRRMGWS